MTAGDDTQLVGLQRRERLDQSRGAISVATGTRHYDRIEPSRWRRTYAAPMRSSPQVATTKFDQLSPAAFSTSARTSARICASSVSVPGRNFR